MADKLLDFKKLKPKEKALIAGLMVVIVISGYFHIIYKPLSRSTSRYDLQAKKSLSRLSDLKTKLPQLEQQKQSIRALGEETQAMLNEIAKIESALPNKNNVSRLLTELVQLGKDLKISSVRQKLESRADYQSIYVELKFNAPYIDTVNYLRKIEAISPFLVIKEVDISEEQAKDDRGGPVVRLILSSFLGDTANGDKIETKSPDPLVISRNIFISKAKPVVKISTTELKLDGITYGPKGATAIVNGEVVRIGSLIENYKVKDIQPDTVIFTDDFEEYIVNITR
ncbi:MAG: type 4a pilus biogenesis protein PilO [Candidatus Omnitrophota bacterium]